MGREPIVGKPCEGCEAVFEGLPKALSASGRIAPNSEPGRPLIVEGTVRWPDGSLTDGVVIYAYHTNASGVYPRNARFAGQAAERHGMLRGWVRTGPDGRYRFATIRPGGYPDSDAPEHIHVHVLEPGRCTYYIDDVLFDDDPRLTPTKRKDLEKGRGGGGVSKPVQRDGLWTVTRDIELGKNIPGYPPRG